MSEAPDLLHDAAVAWDKHVVTFNMVLVRLRAAEAEVERLRAALEAHYLPGACPDCDAALAPGLPARAADDSIMAAKAHPASKEDAKWRALAPEVKPGEVPGYEHECPRCGDYFDKHEVHFCTKPPCAPEVKS